MRDYQLDQPICPIIATSATLMARLAKVSTRKITKESESTTGLRACRAGDGNRTRTISLGIGQIAADKAC